MTDDKMYPSQFGKFYDNITTITQDDLAIGAPFAPLPKSFYVVDQRLNPVQPLASEEEINSSIDNRKKFRVGDFSNPYVSDVLRAFRLLHGKRFYLEIGVFDRGNLAYVSSLLSDDAVLIGIDVQEDLERDELLRQSLKPGQVYHPIIASSRSVKAVEAVGAILSGASLDAVFIDGDHTAYGTLSDYALYEDFVTDDGVFLFHDSVWEGNPKFKGVCDALNEISRVEPVYLVDGANPVRRFCRPFWRDSLWGVVGVIFASDQRWRSY